jgi:hypothetical protein
MYSILNINLWGSDRESHSTRNQRRENFRSLIQTEIPDMIMLQEVDPWCLFSLVDEGYHVVYCPMDEIESQPSVCSKYDIPDFGSFPSGIALASRHPIINTRRSIYGPGSYWPEEGVKRFTQMWCDEGGRFVNGNLNAVLLVCETLIDQKIVSFGTTHCPWDIGRDPVDVHDTNPGCSEHQKFHIQKILDILAKQEKGLMYFGADSNTHSTFSDSLFSRLQTELHYRLSIDPQKFPSLDLRLFKNGKFEANEPKFAWAKIQSVDNIACHPEAPSLIGEVRNGLSDHRGLLSRTSSSIRTQN